MQGTRFRSLASILAVVVGTTPIAGCWNSSDGDDAPMPAPNTMRVDVALSATQVIGGGAATGTATAVITVDLDDLTLSGTVTINGLAATGVTLHRGFAGERGAVVVTLEQDSANQWSVPDDTDITQADLDAINAGGLHLIVATAGFPDGALRGQLRVGDIEIHYVAMTGTQEVPAVTSGATAVAAITFDPSTRDIVVHVNTNGLTGAVAGHVHRALAGVNGGIALELVHDPNDDRHWFAEDAILDVDEQAALQAGALYVNLHTPAHPGGEIRGQIVPEGVEVVFTTLSGDDVVPPVATSATGVAASTLREANGVLTTHVNLVGLTDATGVTVNQAPVAQNGPELLVLEQDPNLLSHWSIVEVALDEAAKTALRNRGLYVVAASAAQPDGEVRGQIEPATSTPGPGTPFSIVTVAPANGATVASIPAVVDLTFNRQPLDASVDIDQFELLASGGDGSFADGDELEVTIVSVTRTSAVLRLDLTGAMSADDVYRIRVDPDGVDALTDEAGTVLDGDGDGNPGGDFISTFTVETGTTAPTFAEIQTEIFSASCAFSGCHGAPTPQLGMNLSAGEAYANIVNVASVQMPSLDRIEPGAPDDSYLVRKVQGTGFGERMPLGQPPLSNALIQKLRDWVAAGAANN